MATCTFVLRMVFTQPSHLIFRTAHLPQPQHSVHNAPIRSTRGASRSPLPRPGVDGEGDRFTEGLARIINVGFTVISTPLSVDPSLDWLQRKPFCAGPRDMSFLPGRIGWEAVTSKTLGFGTFRSTGTSNLSGSWGSFYLILSPVAASIFDWFEERMPTVKPMFRIPDPADVSRATVFLVRPALNWNPWETLSFDDGSIVRPPSAISRNLGRIQELRPTSQ